MNGVLVEYEATLKQTSKGVWYCDGMKCGDKSIEGLGAKLHLLMQELEQVMYRHNYPEKQDDSDGWKKARLAIEAEEKAKKQPEKKEE